MKNSDKLEMQSPSGLFLGSDPLNKEPGRLAKDTDKRDSDLIDSGDKGDDDSTDKADKGDDDSTDKKDSDSKDGRDSGLHGVDGKD